MGVLGEAMDRGEERYPAVEVGGCSLEGLEEEEEGGALSSASVEGEERKASYITQRGEGEGVREAEQGLW
jgi:hypothetical protein